MLLALIAALLAVVATVWLQLHVKRDERAENWQLDTRSSERRDVVRPQQQDSLGEQLAPQSVNLQPQSLVDGMPNRSDLQTNPKGAPDLEAREVLVRSWLDEAFSPRWSEQWFDVCPDGWSRTDHCVAFAEMVVRFSRAIEGSDDYWAMYMEEELTAFADKMKETRSAPWFRVNCSIEGCIFAAAGHKQNRSPSGAFIRAGLRRQSWASEFEEFWLTGCISCPDIDTYIIVMPRRHLDSGINRR